jgi:hypothetical protein
MSTKTKRTYNLSSEAVTHVRELAGRPGAATSQDGVVEFAIERLYRDIRDQEEAAVWSRAAEDPEFRAEMRALATAYGDLDSWPA